MNMFASWSWTVTLYLTLVAAAYLSTQATCKILMQSNDAGVVQNCGGPQTFTAGWEAPQSLKIGAPISYHLDLTFMRPISSGTLNMTLEVRDLPFPMFQRVMPFECRDLHKFSNKCPFKKGQHLSYHGKSSFKPYLPLTPQWYKITVRVFDKQHKLFVCASVAFTVRPDRYKGKHPNQL